jgi:hypothetical protein
VTNDAGRALLAMVIVVAAPSALRAQAHRETISGRVAGDSGKVIVAAQIIATRAPDRAEFRTVTDSAGRYRIVVDSGTGDYLVHISLPTQPTWPAFRKRVTRTAPTDSAFVVDAVLKAPAVQQLAQVTVQARKPTPTRNSDDGLGPGVGASEQRAAGVAASLAPDQRGDLTATALTIPGVTSVPGGISVLGISPSQNSTTLNGMAFPGASVPRDAQTSTTITTSTYDPSLGWAAGAQTRVDLSAGSVFSNRTAHLTFDSPALQYGDPVSAKLGSQFTREIASFGGSGVTPLHTVTYNYGVDLTHMTSAVSTLANLDPAVLELSGVARDSVVRLLQIMNGEHIPITANGVPAARTTNTLSFITRLNTPEYDFNTFEQKPRSGGIILSGLRSQTDAAQATALITPGHDGQTTNTVAQVQGVYSDFITKNLLEDIRTSLSWSEQQGTPYLQLPSGSVLVGSTFPDGTAGVSSLQFGGAPLTSTNKAFGWETQSETKFYTPGSAKHRIKVNADFRYDAVSTISQPNANGTFTYNSLAGLEANTPASFTRALNSPERTGAVWNGYASIGDYYRVSPNFQLVYGARLEGNAYAERPAYNPAVESAFGARTDYTPNTVNVSPRIGFTWSYPKTRNGSGMMFGPLGTFILPQIGVLRGGVGEFRSMMPASLLSNASVNTGLPNGYRQLSCIGSAIPSPDWNTYLTAPGDIPTQCLGGAPSSTQADTAPGVQLVNRNYNAPRSWRGNLSWIASKGWLVWTVEGIVAYNVNQPGTYNLNFANVPRFALADEGRAIYVQPVSVVQSSGVVSPVDARTNQAFGPVVSTLSDLRSEARQLTVTLAPDLNKTHQRVFASMAYVLSSVQQLQRGFDGSTFGSPDERYWSRGNFDARHAFTLSGGLQFKYASVSMFSRLHSGYPFTPMVGSDINGDGLANDRAFIFNPATAIDATLASSTRALLASATPSVRHCLQNQYGQGAAPNSCEGPWGVDLGAQVGINTYPMGEFWRKFNISVNFANPLGGLDQLFNGNHLQGWGNAATPNPVLYYVRGFDPANERYLYTVNPRFGDTRPTNSIQTPFRVTLDVKMNYGPTMAVQQLDLWLRPGRDGVPGPKLTADDLKKRYARNVPNPYRGILQQSDSLLLTTDQVRALTDLQTAYNARTDSAWMDLANWLYALPDHFETKVALAHQEDAIDQAWERARIELQTKLPTVLSPVQLQLLPGFAASLFKAKTTKGMRMFVYGPIN